MTARDDYPVDQFHADVRGVLEAMYDEIDRLRALAAEGLLATDEQRAARESCETCVGLGQVFASRDVERPEVDRWYQCPDCRPSPLTDEQQRLIRLGEAAAEWFRWNARSGLGDDEERGDAERLDAWIRFEDAFTEAERGGE